MGMASWSCPATSRGWHALANVCTDIDHESELIKIIALEKLAIEMLDPVEWQSIVCRETAGSAIKCLLKTILTTIGTRC
jgi:hypothetical protein